MDKPLDFDKYNVYNSVWERIQHANFDQVSKLNAMTYNDRFIEDDHTITGPDECEDVPSNLYNRWTYAFNRYYFSGNLPGCNTDSTVFMIYGCMVGEIRFSYNAYPRYLTIVLISKNLVAIGSYEDGKRLSAMQHRCAEQLRDDTLINPAVISTLKSYFHQSRSEYNINYGRILIRTPEQYMQTMKDIVGHSYMTHVPFKTGKPSEEEVERVFRKLTAIRRFHSYREAVNELLAYQKAHKNSETSEEVPRPTSSKADRNAQKQLWPAFGSKVRASILAAVENDDDNELLNILENIRPQAQAIDFLNSAHDSFEGQPLLHFATKHHYSKIVQVLLELGCDPTVVDYKSKLPYQYSRTEAMKEIYCDFRARHSEKYSWNKTSIPATLDLEVQDPENVEDTMAYNRKNEKSKKRREHRTEARRCFKEDIE